MALKQGHKIGERKGNEKKKSVCVWGGERERESVSKKGTEDKNRTDR